MLLTHKEMTAHIRKRLKVAKVPARVRMDSYCGVMVIDIVTPTYEFNWTPDQLETIGTIAKINRLTGARGSAIDVDNIRMLTGKTQFHFEFHGV